MKEVWIIQCQTGNGVDTWENVWSVHETEEGAFIECTRCNSTLENPGLEQEWFFYRWEVKP